MTRQALTDRERAQLAVAARRGFLVTTLTAERPRLLWWEACVTVGRPSIVLRQRPDGLAAISWSLRSMTDLWWEPRVTAAAQDAIRDQAAAMVQRGGWHANSWTFASSGRSHWVVAAEVEAFAAWLIRFLADPTVYQGTSDPVTTPDAPSARRRPLRFDWATTLDDLEQTACP